MQNRKIEGSLTLASKQSDDKIQIDELALQGSTGMASTYMKNSSLGKYKGTFVSSEAPVEEQLALAEKIGAMMNKARGKKSSTSHIRSQLQMTNPQLLTTDSVKAIPIVSNTVKIEIDKNQTMISGFEKLDETTPEETSKPASTFSFK